MKEPKAKSGPERKRIVGWMLAWKGKIREEVRQLEKTTCDAGTLSFRSGCWLLGALSGQIRWPSRIGRIQAGDVFVPSVVDKVGASRDQIDCYGRTSSAGTVHHPYALVRVRSNSNVIHCSPHIRECKLIYPFP